MAMQDGKGNWHHSASRAKLSDEMAGNKGASSGVKQMKDKADAGAGAMGKTHHPGPTETPISEHVDEHGPAHAVHHMHDMDGDGMHHVSSYHGEAKVGEEDHPGSHHSVHKTHEAAHRHMGEAMGMNHANEDEDNTADMEETPDSEQDQMAGAHKIPGLMA